MSLDASGGDELFSIEDLFIGWRCRKQLQRRLQQRAQKTELFPQDFLEEPSGSASTHQFIERFRISKAYNDYFCGTIAGIDDTAPVPLVFGGSLVSMFEDNSLKLQHIIRESHGMLKSFLKGEVCGFANAVLLCDDRLLFIDRLLRLKDGNIRLDVARHSAKMKDGFVRELAWISQGLESMGLNIDEMYILLLNKDFKAGQTQFFKSFRQKRRQKFMKQDMAHELERLKKQLAENQLISCRNSSCDICVSDQRDKDIFGSIYNLHKSGGLAGQLADQGILWIDELEQVKAPLKQKLKPHHWIQYRAEKSGEEQVNTQALKKFLNGLQWPLFFLDFECYLEALPGWEHAGVWEHVPFLYSLYRMDKNGEELGKPERLEHSLCIAPNDCRVEMIEQLIQSLNGGGSVLVYGIHFEKSLLHRLSLAFPQYRNELQDIISRLVDAQTPFADFSYYHPGQAGKISLKVVLPLLTDYGYDKEQVSSGSEAFAGYYYLLHPELPVKEDWDPYAAQVRNDPERFYREVVNYCDTDTYGLAYLIEVLIKKAAG